MGSFRTNVWSGCLSKISRNCHLLIPKWAGKGIGPQAIQFLKDQAKELGLKAIAAYVLSQNLPSRKMFERSGFAEWGHLPKVCIFDDIERDIYIYGYHPND